MLKNSLYARMIVAIAMMCAIAATLYVIQTGGPVGPERWTMRRLRVLHTYSCNYQEQIGRFPNPATWADELLDGWGGPLASPRVAERFFDGWERPFRYVCPGRHNPNGFDLYSVGPNGIDEGGAGDDIGNWKGSNPKYDRLWDQLAERGYCASASREEGKSDRNQDGSKETSR